ncbi:sensor histidine kinase [Microbacterium dextranolyticum]|uniref:sensor histidine kinase n=1 Tax=Microbacterium dextranolyticum TaxID=36806 RepID=UPI0019599C11|nr:ATP-binding protein [Microbacterium dextranolyticum]
MIADSPPIATDPAARAPLGDVEAGADRFTQTRVERIVSLVIAIGCAVLGTQALLNALGSRQESDLWHVALMAAAFVPLAAMILLLAAGVGGRVASRVCAIVLVGVFVAWPFATHGIEPDPVVHPWIWYLINVATAAAVPAFRLVGQIVWAFGIPLLYGIVRVAQLEPVLGPASAAERTAIIGVVVLDAVFAIILAGVIVSLGWMLRSVAVQTDATRCAAVDSYATAAAADAVEKERVAVAALMHDSVLAALIAAERASSPREEALAVAMAREALTRLANAERDVSEGPDAPESVASIVTGIERNATEIGIAISVDARIARDAPPLPGRVAHAIVLAATQAIANAVQHAGARGLAVRVRDDTRTIAVRVSDTGDGFDPADVQDDRLGIRGSIVARMAAAGGRARVQTGPDGTTIRLEWRRP